MVQSTIQYLARHINHCYLLNECEKRIRLCASLRFFLPSLGRYITTQTTRSQEADAFI